MVGTRYTLASVLIVRRFLAPACVFALLVALAPFAGANAQRETKATASKTKKHCPKGTKLKTVKQHGKKVRRCRKVKTGGGGQEGGSGGGGGGSTPLFEPPGRKLVGSEAVPFLQRYLYNSRFTDCPAGWPNCGVVEERYSHFSSGAFYYCKLGFSPGSDTKFGSEYAVQNAVVEADGSWTFNEVVNNYGNPSYYEWHVTTSGVVTGAYQFNGIEQLGPFQYVTGARDCSY